ncbi:hypothetical protein [Amycolatopsis vastitatis]|uniref:Uncharacterized protein n=1 Tax=Amycolatopsis vastitatis TaxID=1905142 RepID=A0A229TED5_9PSEU|nr:hypothetical protein [Amycolatopsis vastitatis]OXM69607.1 hypothetical protein CF165_08850 [Amycolatopsis vastitatis]
MTAAVISPAANVTALEDGVTELPDDQLRDLAAALDNLAARVRAERDARWRGRATPRPPSEFRTAASCTFCRRVYLADLISVHLVMDHKRDLQTWRSGPR